MDADGKNLTQLTDGGHPFWSPDGQRIAFHNYNEVYVIDADGKNLTQLTDGWNPSWSPDGQRIVFASGRDGDDGDIYVMDADGKNRTQLTDLPVDDRHPSWSPDGQRIAFVSYLGPQDNWSSAIYVIDADGKNLTQLTDYTDNWTPPWSFGGQLWSPDGQRIAFHSPRDENHVTSAIYVMDADGKNRTQLTDDTADDASPAWSPDGQRIAFVSNRDRYWAIYVIYLD